MKAFLVTGALATVASDAADMYAPDSIDVGGLPVKKFLGSFLGATVAGYVTGSGMHPVAALVKALGALAGAEAVSRGAKAVNVPNLGFGPVDAVRIVGGIGGVWLAGKVT